MRGTLPANRPCRRKTGIIPAYAGNTSPWLLRRRLGRDHPRVCGEHADERHHRSSDAGSSPRMRGTPWSWWCSASIPWDHPRVCGEHGFRRFCLADMRGSSPRMRGTPKLPRGKRRQAGIIPAYAGNTKDMTNLLSVSRDHPRVCGEHMPELLLTLSLLGSSPRMRGTRIKVFAWTGACGIIPAYAGNTAAQCLMHCVLRDHPRVCGEHCFEKILRCAAVGSSPRMRGTPITSAPTVARGWDHPRVCGEHTKRL